MITKCLLCMYCGMLAFLGIPSCTSYPSDNIIEELGEEAFDYYLGYDVDFTPLSPEK